MGTIPEMPAALAGVWHMSTEDMYEHLDKQQVNYLLSMSRDYAKRLAEAAYRADDEVAIWKERAKHQKQLAQAMARQAHDEIESLRGEVYNLADLLRTSALRALSAVNPADRTFWLVGEG